MIAHMLTTHMLTRSAYSRHIDSIEEYFDIEDTRRGLVSRLWATITGRNPRTPDRIQPWEAKL